MRLTGRFPYAVFFALLAGWAAAADTYYFTTLAGSPSAGSHDGAATLANFDLPAGVAADGAGNVYVADTGNHTVRKITPAGQVSTLAGKPGESGYADGPGAAARFHYPRSIAAAPDGRLFVGDAYTVRRVSADGTVTTLAGLVGESGFADGIGSVVRFASGGVQALQVEPDGSVLLIDTATLRRLRSDRSVATLFTKEQFSVRELRGMARDAAGNVYLSDRALMQVPDGGSVNQARIIRRSPDGGISLVADQNTGLAGVLGVLGLAIDQSGNLFIATGGAVLRRPAAGGAISVYAALPGIEPTGLAIDGGGNLIVSEINNTIRRISPGGFVTTLAGISMEDSARHADARGRSARFRGPRAVAVTADGICFVADTANHVIRRIGADGTVTTLAGAAGQAGYQDGTGAEARFRSPFDVKVDAAGNVYVVEDNSTVRKITPGGVVTTLIGDGQNPDQSVDGLVRPQGVFGINALGVGPGGEFYVMERGVDRQFGFSLIPPRLFKITPDRVVTKLWQSFTYDSIIGGLAVAPDGTVYFSDSYGNRVLKLRPGGVAVEVPLTTFSPAGLAVSPSGAVFLTGGNYYLDCAVARLLPDGTLEMIGGQLHEHGAVDGIAGDARFERPAGIAVDASGRLYIACENNTIRQGLIATAPQIVSQPQGRAVAAGTSVQFDVAAAAVPAPAYQWYYNSGRINGATAASYGLSAANILDAGEYSVVVTNELGSVTSSKAVLAVTAPTTPPPAPTPPATGGGAAGGGGAPSGWFLGALATLAAVRLWRRRLAVIFRRRCPMATRATGRL